LSAAVHTITLATRWTDFDALGHITDVAYPAFCDEARDAFLASTVGSFEEWPTVVAHIGIDYRRELRYPTPEVLVRTRVAEIGRTSVSFEQEVVGPDGEVAARERSVVVAWDESARGPREIGGEDRRRLLPDSR
jgi:acyl-CoA thioester hydrolase